MLLKIPSNLAFNSSRDGTSTASLCGLFQCLTTLTANNFFLTSNVKSLCQFKAIPPCPITTCPCQKSLSSSLAGPFRFWAAAPTAPWSLLFSRLDNPNILSLILPLSWFSSSQSPTGQDNSATLQSLIFSVVIFCKF